jgi:hypothetical protein
LEKVRVFILEYLPTKDSQTESPDIEYYILPDRIAKGVLPAGKYQWKDGSAVVYELQTEDGYNIPASTRLITSTYETFKVLCNNELPYCVTETPDKSKKHLEQLNAKFKERFSTLREKK